MGNNREIAEFNPSDGFTPGQAFKLNFNFRQLARAIFGLSGNSGEPGPPGPKGDKGDKGDPGPQGPQGPQGVQGPQGEQGPQGIAGATGPQGLQGPQGPQGPQGEQGIQGEGFAVYRTYPSIAAMNADAANVDEGKFVVIASDVSDPDNAKLFVRDAQGFTLITDMSGAQGMQGEQGPQGVPGPQGATGPQGQQGIQGEQGPQGPQGPQGVQGIQGPPGVIDPITTQMIDDIVVEDPYVDNGEALTPTGLGYLWGKVKALVSGAISGLVTGVKGNAESAYRTGNVNLTAANIGAVNKAGDTMTGNLIIQNANFYRKNTSMTRGTTPSVTQYSTYEFQDSAGKRLSQIEHVLDTSGNSMLQLYVLGHHTSSDQYSGFRITKARGNTNAATMVYDANSGLLTVPGRLYCTSDVISVGYMDIDSSDTNTAALRLRTAKSFGGSVNNAIVFHRTWTESTYTIQIASDRRLKNHIEYLDKHDSILFIKSLNPVLYSLKSDKNNDKHLGFYAQDVQESDVWNTSIVRESKNANDNEDSVFSLDYTQLHAPIVAALKAALERIDQLEAQVAELEAKLDEAP